MSAGVTGFLVAALLLALLSSILAVISENTVFNNPFSPWNDDGFPLNLVVWIAGFWTFWGGVFCLYYRAAGNLDASRRRSPGS